MADFSALKASIQAAIRQNGQEAITGDILQDILIAVVETLGDSAISDLQSSIVSEGTVRQNADGTLQTDINNEALARQSADSTLHGEIVSEGTARQAADTALGGRIDGLQTAINGINTKLAEGYIYAGIATLSTNPGTPSGKVFYIAVSSGTYTNFSNLTVAQGINILKYNGSAWSKDVVYAIDARPKKNSQNLVTSGGIFDNMGALDVSELNATENPHTLAQYADLSAALAAIPTDYQKGGMSVKFVQSSDNKYVQFRCVAEEFTTDVAKWEEYDSNTVKGKVFYVTDSDGNIIAKIDKDGVHSVDFKIGEEGDSVANALNNVATQISTAVNAEKLLREQAVAEEEQRARNEENKKLNFSISDNAFYFTDANGYIIAKIDAKGVHSVNIEDEPNKIKNDNIVVTDNNGYIIFKIDNEGIHAPNLSKGGEVNSDNITIQDKNGYIVARIDKDGIHSAKDKHAVACMVLSESYYPTAAPTRDSDGNVTFVEVMFETGIAGSISITYTNGNSSSVAVAYGDYNYTITINRDVDGNVETVNVQ